MPEDRNTTNYIPILTQTQYRSQSWKQSEQEAKGELTLNT